MSQKRNRSINWDEEEKQLFCSVLKDFTHILENKSLNTNTSNLKAKAWEEVHTKFNEVNIRKRELPQLQIQWKKMKINARRASSSFKKEYMKTGGGSRPPTPDSVLTQVKDLLNPAELLKDYNIYDSDWCPVTPKSKIILERDNEELMAGLSQDVVMDVELDSVENTCSQIANPEVIATEKENYVEVEETSTDKTSTPAQIRDTPLIKPIKRKMPPKQVYQSSKGCLKYPKKSIAIKDDDYKLTMINHSKMLKDEVHKSRMAREEDYTKLQ